MNAPFLRDMGVYFANKKYIKKIFSTILLSLLLGCITKGIFSIWCEKKELVYNKTCEVSDYQLGPALKKNPYICIIEAESD